jgi:hypothetical protein
MTPGLRRPLVPVALSWIAFTTSIIKFLTRRFGLEPLPGVREKAGDLTDAFEF